MIGKGAFGKVYKGTLQDKSIVAVKKINLIGHTIKENFVKEVSVHSQINHRSVTRLIGYCFEEDALMMVIEYISGGNLSDFLHNNDRPICLGTRLMIAIECAEALVYMHSCMRPRVIIHGDIKPANILLDQHHNAKVSDFGISRLINMDMTLYTKNIKGSIGYMDPLFAQDGRVTTKSDVYSFGVVLVELFTRKRVRSEDGKVNLVNIFTSSFSEGFRKVRDMFDREIADQRNMKILEGIGKLAGECLRLENHKRPEMKDVAERLRTLMKILDRREEKVPLFFWRTKYKPVAAPASKTTAITKLMRIGSTATTFQVELENLLQASVEVLGQGVLGTTYKAKLESGVTVVVKRLKSVEDLLSEEEFGRRAMAIGAVENEFVLPLRWYYFSKDEVLLVYDYMPMGSLATLLHGKWDDDSGQDELDLKQRSTIALTAARSLAAIHSAGAEVCHGNIKSSNVFLTDGGYDAMLSEHGLMTFLISSSSLPAVTMSGYHAPEAADIQCVSQEADVYSFRVLLLELFTGKRPQNVLGMDLPLWVWYVSREQWMAKVIDARLLSPQPSPQEETAMMQLVQLAMVCCAEKPTDRPAISDVLQRIKDIRLPLVRSSSIPNIAKDSDFATAVIDQLSRSPTTMLGIGTFGITTKNQLDERTLVVKTGEGVNLSNTEFRKRIAQIMSVKNEHVLPLLLYYYFADDKRVVLLYNYMPMRSLAQWLHGQRGFDGMAPPMHLHCDRRLAIALSVARGVASIHSGGPSSYHGNIKSSNVLLTCDLDEAAPAAVLSEHSLAALAGPSSFKRMMSSGYLAPEVTAASGLSQEADIYSFGVLLIELLTGRDPRTAMDKGQDLPLWLYSVPQESWLHEALDPELVADEQQQDAVHEGCRNSCSSPWIAVCASS
uniref:Protein kinase domain-containing protein n=1 Tax=Oryza punctata TaxID=4537 RepID=A0A0E0KEF0_ORYPU